MQLLRPENKDFGTKWYLYDMGLSLAGKGLLKINLCGSI